MPGGVCAVLDYDVDMMAEYIAEMATRLASPANPVPVSPSFRKFVHQLLTSTRLPRTTVLLGMNYLAKRINMLKAAESELFTGDGQLWRMLTVALMLGSKFLDDNTFQNRSWAEVSGLPVSELNTLEHQWLTVITWNLFVNLDESKDYNAWLHSWEDWLKTKREHQQAHRERLQSLSPIDTDVRTRTSSMQSWGQSQSEFDSAASAKRSEYVAQQSFRPRENWSVPPRHQINPWHQPLTPPDSAYGTPENRTPAASTASSRYNEWLVQVAAASNLPTAYQSTATHSSFEGHRAQPGQGHYVSDAQRYGHQFYDLGVLDCNCVNCMPGKQQPYLTSNHGYGQMVAG